MKIALIQQAASPDRLENRRRGLEAARRAAADGAQVLVFAELAFDPFYPQVPADARSLDLAEPVPGPTTEPFCRLAREKGVVIVLNVFERGADGRTYDSSPVIDADGAILGAARMIHITEYAHFHEQGYYTPGDRGPAVFPTRAGRIGVAICYDRHFPECMRALGLARPDLVVVPQAGTAGEWPADLFEAELQVAAFQNGYFTALCNRVGKEANLTFAGESFVCGPDGRVLARAGSGTEEILHCGIDPGRLAASAARRLFLRDRRPELYGEWLGPQAGPTA